MTGTPASIARLPDWEPRLLAFLEQKTGVLFTWGATDCALFSADAVLAQTGVDPASAYRGRYSTAVGSVRALKRHGAGTLEATTDAMFPAIVPAFARRGDLVMVDGMLGVCIGADAVFVGTEQLGDEERAGLVRFPRAAWARAWRIG